MAKAVAAEVSRTGGLTEQRADDVHRGRYRSGEDRYAVHLFTCGTGSQDGDMLWLMWNKLVGS
jgi:hypothetical protein